MIGPWCGKSCWSRKLLNTANVLWKHSPPALVYNPSCSPGFVGHFAIHLWRQEKGKINSLKQSTEILPWRPKARNQRFPNLLIAADCILLFCHSCKRKNHKKPNKIPNKPKTPQNKTTKQTKPNKQNKTNKKPETKKTTTLHFGV